MLHTDLTVYVVDSDESIGEALATLLSTYGIRVEVFLDAESFLEVGPDNSVINACLLVEANLSGGSGVSLLRQLRAREFEWPIFLSSSAVTEDQRRRLIRFGATDVIEKPFVSTFLLERIRALST